MPSIELFTEDPIQVTGVDWWVLACQDIRLLSRLYGRKISRGSAAT